ncbi:MAG: SDR family NAD(P)-dependent oxidoreductase [Cyanobacteria bacterium M_surface_9_m1_291]|nr:SDR family NAD(P)-dependent oxidoreductase [Cyanobacteria bacterium M_surface_9_m1_291]
MDPASPWRDWQGHALIVGGGGLGRALLAALPARAPQLQLTLATRQPRSQEEWQLDLTDDASLGALQQHAVTDLQPLRLVINTAGLLHGPCLQPEKRLAAVSRGQLLDSFAVNAFGPILLAQAVAEALPRNQNSHFASLSARVGSIGDNRLGGWYSYRAAKAAQNQLLRTLALEWQRRLPQCCVSLLHPGTTATALSQPFRAGVEAARLFTPPQAAGYLLDVLQGLDPERSGGFWAWDGEAIPW